MRMLLAQGPLLALAMLDLRRPARQSARQDGAPHHKRHRSSSIISRQRARSRTIRSSSKSLRLLPIHRFASASSRSGRCEK